jgi:hypothetical protein
MATDGNFSVDMDGWSYVADKGPVLDWTLSSGKEPGIESFSTFRVFGFPKGHSLVTDLPGYYLVNSCEESAAQVQVLTAPALLHYQDSDTPPSYLLYFKWLESAGKVYAMTLPTDLKLPTDVDAPIKWLTEKDIKPVKLALVAKCEPLENKDGKALAKNLELWMKEHFNFFQRRKLKSFSNCRAYLSHQTFTKHVETVASIVEEDFVSQLSASCGTGTGKNTTTEGTSADNASSQAYEAELATFMDCLHFVKTVWADLAAKIAVPLGNRILEVPLDPPVAGAEVDTSALAALIDKSNTKHKHKLQLLLKKGKELAELAAGKGEDLPPSSPLKPPSPPSITSPAAPNSEPPTVDDVNELPVDLVDVDFLQAIQAEPAEIVHGKRGPRPIDRFSPPLKISKSNPPSKDSTTSANSNSSERGKYKMSGLFSKDPVKAAAAREKMRAAGIELPARALTGTPKSGGGSTGGSSTAMRPCMNSFEPLNSIELHNP